MDQATASYVHDFEEGHREQGDLLGGKGANLAEMTWLGLPVPPGFTIDTKACRAYLTAGEPPRQLEAQIDSHLAALEARMGRGLGDPTDPLLVSVRSGAKSFRRPALRAAASRSTRASASARACPKTLR